MSHKHRNGIRRPRDDRLGGATSSRLRRLTDIRAKARESNMQTRCEQCQTKMEFGPVVRRKGLTPSERKRFPDDHSNRALDAAGHVRQNVMFFNDPDAEFFCSVACYRECLRECDKFLLGVQKKGTMEERIMAMVDEAAQTLQRKESLRSLWESIGR